MTRKLAHIEVIEDINPIPNADSIEVVSVLGWHCVAKKGEFSAGDKVIYIECDSIVPELPQYEFLRERKFRVRTIKLRGQVSQGLVLPISSLPENYRGEKSVGTDVTEALGIIKYDPQLEEEKAETSFAPKSAFDKFMRRFAWYRKLFVKKTSGKFPAWIKKTDEERIQNMPHILIQYGGKLFEISEKLDGQSATYFLRKSGRTLFGKKKYEFGVCSRNLRIKTPNNSSWWTVAKNYHMEEVLLNLIGSEDYVVLQGEILGTEIQGNKYKVKNHEFYAFNLLYPNRQTSWMDMVTPLLQHGILTVPILYVHAYLPDNVDEMVEISKGKSYIYPKAEREGLVVRNRDLGVSFKAINPDFLLKNNE